MSRKGRINLPKIRKSEVKILQEVRISLLRLVQLVMSLVTTLRLSKNAKTVNRCLKTLNSCPTPTLFMKILTKAHLTTPKIGPISSG